MAHFNVYVKGRERPYEVSGGELKTTEDAEAHFEKIIKAGLAAPGAPKLEIDRVEEQK